MALSSFWTAGACSIYEARHLANDWNLEFTFHGKRILNPVPAIRDLQHKIRNPQRAIQKPRFSLMHLILEECQPVSRRVSFHKRRSSVRKSDKGAIMGSHLIQAAENVPRKLNFYFLNFPYCIPKFHMSCRSSRYFFSLLSCWYCHCYLGQGNATRRVLLLAGAGENWNLHDSWPRFWYERQR